VTDGKTLAIAVTGAGPSSDIGQLITIAARHGWTSSVLATPHAQAFIDEPLIEQLTGTPVRWDYTSRPNGSPRAVGRPDALIVAPATFNTINKIAAGVADSYALTTIAEQIGLGTPTVIVPFVNTAFAARRPFRQSVDALRAEGVQVYFGPEHGWEPHPPGKGAAKQENFPWQQAFALLTSQS
jgi:phosphopantothenoylcysteine synthetase/decarboxylase